MRAGKPYIVKEYAELANGPATYLSHKAPLKNGKGDIIGTIGISFEITDYLKPQTIAITSDDTHNNRSPKAPYYLGQKFGNTYLTARELQVFKRLVMGESAKTIGAILYISPKTVESHTENIKNKLKVKTKAEIIGVAIREGLIHLLQNNTELC